VRFVPSRFSTPQLPGSAIFVAVRTPASFYRVDAVPWPQVLSRTSQHSVHANRNGTTVSLSNAIYLSSIDTLISTSFMQFQYNVSFIFSFSYQSHVPSYPISLSLYRHAPTSRDHTSYNVIMSMPIAPRSVYFALSLFLFSICVSHVKRETFIQNRYGITSCHDPG